jgi:hypothetical protein
MEYGASHGVPRHTKPPQLCPHEPDVAMAAGDLNSIGATAFIYPMIRGRDRAFDIPVMLRDPSSHVTRLSGALPTHLSLVHAVGNQILPIAGSVDRCNLTGQLLGNSGNPSGPLFHHGYALEQAVGSAAFSSMLMRTPQSMIFGSPLLKRLSRISKLIRSGPIECLSTGPCL